MKISVITVCYNAAETLERTMQSVLEQTYRDIEYIIIDGGSTDGTLDIIRKYEDRFAYWVSEPDGGIYDAMNKGVMHATGEWVNFMNAGDRFVDEKVVETLFSEEIESSYGCVFGDTLFAYREKNKVIKYGDDSIHKIMPSCHQSIFCRRNLLLKYPFDLKYRIAADLAFFYRLKTEGCLSKYIDFIVAVYDASDGVSGRNLKETGKEILKITNPSYLYYIKYLLLRVKLLFMNVLELMKKNEKNNVSIWN